jgi:hypothetical protein
MKTRPRLVDNPRRKLAAQVRKEAGAVREETRARKARFDAAHAKGMAALKARDFDAMNEAIQEEKAAIRPRRAAKAKPPNRG